MKFKKSAISGEYMIGVKENNSIEVFRVYDNTKGALREVAEQEGFEYDPNWNTRQFGAKLCKQFGDGRQATLGCYNIYILDTETVEVYRTYDNTKGALREIAEKIGFEVDPKWNTQQFGSKLVDFINGKGKGTIAIAQIDTEKAKADAEEIDTASVDKAKAEVAAAQAELERMKAEAEKAKAEAEKAKAAAEKAAADKAKAEAEKTKAEAAAAKPAATGANNGAMPGLFSVAENKKVRFSMGNLQFNPKKYEFRFALHQYDIIGKDNTKIATNYDGWVDLFGYGTSGYMGCEPTEISKEDGQYPRDDIANTNYDWGVYNPISNGGNKEGLWRTMTKEECEYLFKTRPKAEKLRAQARVNGINGLIILPDDFYEHRVRVPFDSTPAGFSGNSYDLTQWATLEATGAIFLPCCGLRCGTAIENLSRYWTSSRDNKYSTLFYYCLFDFSEKRIDTSFSSYSHNGQAVRLVQDVK